MRHHGRMSARRKPTVMESLPATRPHRRSDKRPAPAAAATAPAAEAPAAAATAPAAEAPVARTVPGPARTAVEAAVELAEIGLSASARALRQALSRLPRP
jgi:hypothetical protein